VWALDHDGGALAGPAWARARAVITDAVAVWSHDDAERLSLTEMDIEGWVRLASLCREVQGGPPLRVSIADRVELYHVARDRFTTGSPADRRALVAVGPYWSQVRNVWKAAAAERQQAWISRAPLPPPMTTESSGYFKAVLGGDVEGLVRSVYDVLGPFRMDGA
ncbi:MAG TPA: hypothetical protein PKA64_09240, partial [Myxococcota bacterium]|nr:hypothetical protein [Myxococcota bacterium]